MPYITASGVSIPQGTDAYTPPTQFKVWGDKAATYENRVVVALDSDRTALASPVLRDGLECYVTATGITWLYRGTVWRAWDSDWIAYTPTFTNITVGSGTKVGQYRYSAGQVYVEGRFVYGSGSAVLGSSAVNHPAGLSISASQQADPYPLGRADILKFGSAIYPGFVTTNNGTTAAQFNYVNAASTAAVDTALSATAPITFAANDAIAWKYDFTPA